MDDCVHIEVDIECGRHSELIEWAKRLHTTPEELAHRAIAAWLDEMADGNRPPDTAEGES